MFKEMVILCSLCLREMKKVVWLFLIKLCFKFRLLNINKFLKFYVNNKGNYFSFLKYVGLL